MAEYEVVEAIQALEANYFIPIHFAEGNEQLFMLDYGDDIADTTECEALCLAHYEHHEFD